MSSLRSCCAAPTRPNLPAIPETLAAFNGRYLEEGYTDLPLYLDTFQETLKSLMQGASDAAIQHDPDSPWEEAPGAPHVTVYWASVAGVRGPVVCSTATMPGVDADVLFSLMTSKEGFAIIDPDTGHKEPLEVLTPCWRDRCELTYGVSKVPAPMCWERSYLVLNAVDTAQRLYISVPVLHKVVPLEQDEKDKRIRANNVWATWVEATADGCIMRSMCWVDFGGSIPPGQVYAAIKNSFFPDFHKRLAVHIQQKPDQYIKAGKKADAQDIIFKQGPASTPVKRQASDATVDSDFWIRVPSAAPSPSKWSFR